MRGVHASIEDRNNDAAAASRHVPCLWRLNFGEVPFVWVVRVVRNQIRGQNFIQLGKLNARVVLQCFEDLVARRLGHLQNADLDGGDLVHLHRVVLAEKPVQVRFGDASMGLDQKPAWNAVEVFCLKEAGTCQCMNRGENLQRPGHGAEKIPVWLLRMLHKKMWYALSRTPGG